MVKIATTDAEKLANLVAEYTTLSAAHAKALSFIEGLNKSDRLETIQEICKQTHRTAADRIRAIEEFIRSIQ